MRGGATRDPLTTYAEAVELVDRGEAPELTVRAVELLREGLRPIDMPERLGVSRSRCYQALNDPFGHRARRRKAKVSGACAKCGARLVNSGQQIRPGAMCLACWRETESTRGKARIIAEMQRWERLYGAPPTAYEWSLAMVYNQQRRYAEGTANGRPSDATVAEIEKRHREDGPWPATRTAIHLFGRWNKAIEAAGFEPLTSGSGRRRAAA